MTEIITPNVLNINNRVIETYSLQTRASQERREAAGLNGTGDLQSNLYIAPIQEFYVLQAVNLTRNEYNSWSLERINQSVLVESIYIDSPSQDNFDFEVLQQGVKIFDFRLSRNNTPYQFPTNPMTPGVVIRIQPTSTINLLRIVLKPCVILETLDTDEHINYAGNQA